MGKTQSTTSTTRPTVAQAHARLDEFGGEISDIKALLTRLVGEQPAKVTGKAKAAKVSKTEAPATVTFKYLRAALKAHKAAGAVPAGVTVRDAIAQGLITEKGNLPDGTVPVVDASALTPNVRSKAKAAKPKATAKRTKKQRKAARKHAQSAQRRANGTIAPKSEWEIRALLASQGLSPKQVDKQTAKAVALLG